MFCIVGDFVVLNVCGVGVELLFFIDCLKEICIDEVCE